MQPQNLLYDQIYDLVAFRVVVDTRARVLRGARRRARQLEAGARALQGLHRAAQGEHVPVAAHHGDRPLRRAHRGADPHPRDAPRRRAGHRRALEVQGRRRRRGSRTRSASPGCAQLLEWQQNLQDPQEFLQLGQGATCSATRSSCFTPKGDVLNFPEGATVIDFAYRIHSEVGHHCAGARVNGKLVPLRYRLRNGDTIEIITTPQQTPRKDWLKFVKTPRASAKIRAWIKAQQRTRSVAVGREILERDLGRYKLELGKLRKEGRLADGARGAFLEGRGESARRGRLRPDHPAPGAVEAAAAGRAAGAAGDEAGGSSEEALPAGGPPASAGRERRRRRRARERRRGRAGPLRPVLRPAARRADRRVHHTRARRDRAFGELPARARERSRAAASTWCGPARR